MEIFQGDGKKIDQLNEILVKKAGFSSCYPISTQSKLAPFVWIMNKIEVMVQHFENVTPLTSDEVVLES